MVQVQYQEMFDLAMETLGTENSDGVTCYAYEEVVDFVKSRVDNFDEDCFQKVLALAMWDSVAQGHGVTVSNESFLTLELEEGE